MLAAILRTAVALEANRDYLTDLDQILGDGDLGITAGKIAAALRRFVEAGNEGAAGPDAGISGLSSETGQDDDEVDIGKYLGQLGLEINRAASSSFGTLLATAVMRAGRAVRGASELTGSDLARMLTAADEGIQQRGKARPGDKTIVDVLHPAAQSFGTAIGQGKNMVEAFDAALAAGQSGLESVTPLRSQVGRSSWIGERTEGEIDPGGAAGLIILIALGERAV